MLLTALIRTARANEGERDVGNSRHMGKWTIDKGQRLNHFTWKNHNRKTDMADVAKKRASVVRCFLFVFFACDSQRFSSRRLARPFCPYRCDVWLAS